MVCYGVLLLVSTSQADLVSRLGGQAVYDTDLNITWLADANAGAGSVFDDGASTNDGLMTWASAVAWAGSVSLGGFTDWRLPSTLQPGADWWSGTTFAPIPEFAWEFRFANGNQSALNKSTFTLLAWAVHDGDIAVIPVPAAVWLFGSTLGLLGWMRRVAMGISTVGFRRSH